MANAVATINNAFIDALTEQVKQKQEAGLTIPADYSPSNALMGAYLWLKDHNDILTGCTQPSIANSLMDMVTMGLSVQKQQGYFIKYGNTCHFQRSYFGNVTIARRYGMKDITANIVYEGDTFEAEADPETGHLHLVKHVVDLFRDENAPMKGAYAVVTMADGSSYMELMTMSQIKAAWRQSKNYRDGGNGVHQKFPDQMAKKTVLNRLLKSIVNTHGDSYVVAAMSDSETIDSVDIIEAEVSQDIAERANAIPFEYEDESYDPDIIEAEQIEFKEMEASNE